MLLLWYDAKEDIAAGAKEQVVLSLQLRLKRLNIRRGCNCSRSAECYRYAAALIKMPGQL
jgi:hypothetical protein